MKLKELLSAIEPLKRLSSKRLTTYQKTREIVKLRKVVEQELDFYYEEEKKLISIYAEKGKDGSPLFLEDGRLRLKDIDSKIAFEKEVVSLREIDVDGIELIKLSERDFISCDDIPTVEDMLALESIILFED